MNRRALLVASGLGVAGVGGGVWRATQDDLSLVVQNNTMDQKPVMLSVTDDDNTIYSDSFEVPASESETRSNVIGPGEYRIRLSLEHLEDRALEQSTDTRLCHDPVVTFEIDIGNAIAFSRDC